MFPTEKKYKVLDNAPVIGQDIYIWQTKDDKGSNNMLPAVITEISPNGYEVKVNCGGAIIPYPTSWLRTLVRYVAVYESESSTTVKFYKELHKFTKDFQDMYNSNFFRKIFYNGEHITARSFNKTTFVAKV
jgi:hypothetical protein